MNLYGPPNLTRWLLFVGLFPLWLLLWGWVRLRAKLYHWGWLASYQPRKPVISVGNITLGGTGKSPTSSALIGHFLAQGKQVGLLSRGYGVTIPKEETRTLHPNSKTAGPAFFGDEPWMIAQQNPGLRLFVGPNRVRAAQLAESEVDLLILDDGFQHLPLQRSLNLVLVEGQRRFGSGWMVPLGPLREPLSALHRADALILTKAQPGDFEAFTQQVAAWGLNAPLFEATYQAVALEGASGTREIQSVYHQSVILVSGIANPTSFEATVQALGARVEKHFIFPDHHEFDEGELNLLQSCVQKNANSLVLCTEKDYAKLTKALPEIFPLFFVRMAVGFQPAFWDWVEEKLREIKKK